jgi:hypothetical protein
MRKVSTDVIMIRYIRAIGVKVAGETFVVWDIEFWAECCARLDDSM